MSEVIVSQITKAGKTRAQYSAEIAASRLRVCQRCGKEYVKKRRHLNEGNRYCSRACSNDAKGLVRHLARVTFKSCFVYFKACVECNKIFTARHKEKLCCSDVCECNRISVLPKIKLCACCGAEFKPIYKCGGDASVDYCSNECRLIMQRRNQNAGKTKRKLRMRGVTVETVHPFKVFDRDGWRCQLCGIKTPKTKRGSYDDNAPELDHILPIAKGGEHSYLNTQCACRKCNRDKSDKPLGQTLLFV